MANGPAAINPNLSGASGYQTGMYGHGSAAGRKAEQVATGTVAVAKETGLNSLKFPMKAEGQVVAKGLGAVAAAFKLLRIG